MVEIIAKLYAAPGICTVWWRTCSSWNFAKPATGTAPNMGLSTSRPLTARARHACSNLASAPCSRTRPSAGVAGLHVVRKSVSPEGSLEEHDADDRAKQPGNRGKARCFAGSDVGRLLHDA